MALQQPRLLRLLLSPRRRAQSAQRRCLGRIRRNKRQLLDHQAPVTQLAANHRQEGTQRAVVIPHPEAIHQEVTQHLVVTLRQEAIHLGVTILQVAINLQGEAHPGATKHLEGTRQVGATLLWETALAATMLRPVTQVRLLVATLEMMAIPAGGLVVGLQEDRLPVEHLVVAMMMF